jgi:NADH-quinone oxidoreductase subunit A
MGMTGGQGAVLWPLAVYFAAVLVMVASMIGISYVLGQRHREKATGKPYESGIASTGSVRIRFDIQFYLVAMFFVIFDIEAVFIIAWAAVLREAGWAGYLEVLFFIVVLAILLVYLWRLGGLDWGVSRIRKMQVRQGKGR